MANQKKVEYVYMIHNEGTNEVLMGARKMHSPFYMMESYAIKKRDELNKRLKQYPSCKKADLYKIVKYKLVPINDVL